MTGDPERRWFGGRGRFSCLAPVTLRGAQYPHPHAIASGGHDGVVRVWDVLGDQSQLISFAAHAGHVADLAPVMVSGQQFVASAGADSFVRIWDLESTRTPVWSVETPQDPRAITRLTLPDGAELLAVGGGGTKDWGWLRVWDVTSKELVFNTRTLEIRALASARLPDGNVVLAGCGFGVADYRSSRNTTVWQVTAERGFTALTQFGLIGGGDLAFIELSDGRQLIVSPGHLVDAADGTPLFFAPPTLTWSIATVRLPGGKQIVACGGPYGEISFLDIELGLKQDNRSAWERLANPLDKRPGELGEVREHEFYVYALASMPSLEGNGDLLVSGAQDGTMRVWDPATRKCVKKPITGHAGAITSLAAINNGTDQALLVSGDTTGSVWCWDQTGTRRAGPLTGHADVGGGVLALAADPTASDAVLVGGGNAQLTAWQDITGSSPTRTVITQDQGSIYGGVNGVTIVPSPEDALLVAMTAESGRTRLWRRDGDRWSELFPEASEPHLPGSKAIVALPAVADTIVAYTRGSNIWLRRLSHWENPQVFETESGSAPTVLAAVDIDGATLLACGHASGYIRLYNVISGEKACEIETESGAITAMATWRTPEGATLLACGHDTGEITTWNVPGGVPDRWVHAHHGSVTALAAMSFSAGTPRLVSGGSDGLICLWDPPTIGVGAYQLANELATSGFGDQPSPRDLLGRTAIVEVVTEILSRPTRPEFSRESLDDGPTVIALDGVWGSGKTTIMGLIYDKLLARLSPVTPVSLRRLTPASAQRLIRNQSVSREPVPADTQRIRGACILPAWFDPWVHQSGEQLWAGLARTVIGAADKALSHDTNGRHRYWFAHNARRVDLHLVRRQIWLRTASPLLGPAAIAVLIPVIVQLVLKSADRGAQIALLYGFRLTVLTLAILLPIILAVAGIIHTLVRYFFGDAADYLDAALFQGPLPLIKENQALLRDPMYQADSGYLYLVQHDIDEILDDLHGGGYSLVVFIDDLDRCAPPTAAAMLEAMNLFLSGALPRARFVIGLDSAVTAGHVDMAYEKLHADPATLHPGDPSLGWTFLRKLIQLPIPMPAMSQEAVDLLIEGSLGASTLLGPADWGGSRNLWTFPSTDRRTERDSPSAQSSVHAENPVHTGSAAAASPNALTSPPPLGPLPLAAMYRRDAGQRWAWSLQALEDSPEVRAKLRSRLVAQPHLTAREGKRLITVWQYCARMMDHWQPLPAADTLERAQALILVAEIITRWPACMASFRKVFPKDAQLQNPPQTGVQILAAAADSDAWHSALQDTGLDKFSDNTAIRQLFGDPHGTMAADLFTQLIFGTDPGRSGSKLTVP